MSFLTKYQYAQSAKQLSTEDKVGLIEQAITTSQNLEIIYLKAKDVKSHRTIRPQSVGEMDYKGVTFLGLSAYCLMRKQARHFNVEKILEMKIV